jgi:Sulfotransferase domain
MVAQRGTFSRCEDELPFTPDPRGGKMTTGGMQSMTTAGATTAEQVDTPAACLRVAMWSGPRNISTAMLRSWGNRADTFPCDEPLYAHYLHVTGVDHPAREEVIRSQNVDWRKVVAYLTGPVPLGRAVFFQKHMTHHLLPNIDREWLSRLKHVFLIRDPAQMLNSLVRTMPHATLADTGLAQQVELYEDLVERLGVAPTIIDAQDVLERPEAVLRALCACLGVSFDPAMLRWSPGPRSTDGVWAPYWYRAVESSTGFAPPLRTRPALPASLVPLLRQCTPFYERLYVHRLRA